MPKLKHKTFREDSPFAEKALIRLNIFIRKQRIEPARVVSVCFTRSDGDVIYDLLYWNGESNDLQELRDYMLFTNIES